MPTGKLRAGYVKVAGVVRVEVYASLLALKEEAGLPTLSQAVGVALREWHQRCRGGVLNHFGTAGNPRAGRSDERGFEPSSKPVEGH